jgi:hypothetical protein
MYTQEQFHKNMAMDDNMMKADGLRDAIWQAEEDQKAIELAEALLAIRNDAWDNYERDMEIYALQHELQGCWNCMWDDEELRVELTDMYRHDRRSFERVYEGVYTTLHPIDSKRYL